MGIIRPTIKSILRPTLNPVLRGISGSITRFFTEFDDVAQSYIDSGGIILTNGNVIEMEVSFSVVAGVSQSNLIGLYTSDITEAFGLRIDEAGGQGFLKFYSEGLTPGVGTTNLFDGKIHKASARVNKTTGAFAVFLDGAEEYTGTHNNIAKLVDSYRASLGARIKETGGIVDSYLSGIAADAKVYSDGATVLDIPIDQNYTPTNNTVIDRASGNNGTFINVAEGDSTRYTLGDGEWVTAENISNGGFDSQEDWIDESQGSGSAVISGRQAIVSGDSFAERGELAQVNHTKAGITYEIRGEVLVANGAFLVARDPSLGLIEAFAIAETGEFSFYFEALSSSTKISLRSQGGETIFDNISLKGRLDIA